MTILRGFLSPVEDLLLLVVVRFANWASFKSEFHYLRVDGVLHNWEASLSGEVRKMKKVVSWVPPLEAEVKFNVDGGS